MAEKQEILKISGMAEEQGLPQDEPPSYLSDISGMGNPSYGQDYTAPPAYSLQGQPGYPPQTQPGNPPQYPSQGDGDYPKTGQPGSPTGCNQQQPMPAGTMQSTHNVTVMQTGEPMVVGAVIPPDHFGLAWLSCLLCWPFGVCAILNSNNARDAINRGDLASANTYSQSAKQYSYLAIGFGIGGIILSSVIFLAVLLPLLLLNR